MGKQTTSGGEFPSFPADKLVIRNVWYPVLEIKSYPESNPKALNGERTFFITADSYVETPDGKVGYRDILSDSIIYLNQLDTILDRGSMNRAIERIGKPLIPTMEGGNNFEVKNWGVQSRDTLIGGFHDPATKGIYLNPNRGSVGINTSIYELRSLLRHELIHYRDNDKYSKDRKYTFEDHANVYLEQMQYEEFMNTKPEFRAQIIHAYVIRKWNQVKKENPGIENYKKFYDDIKDFNNNLGKKIKAVISVTKYGGFVQYSDDLKSFSIEVDGENFGNFKYESKKSPYD